MYDPWAGVLDRLFPSPDPYLNDPVGFICDELDEHLWSAQIDICHSVRDNKWIAVKACHGPGKSYIAARIVLWWIRTHPIGTAKVVTSAPTFHQVRAILWGEMRRAGHKSDNMPGEIRETEWIIDGELVAFGRKPANVAKNSGDDTVAAFQGIHADYLLVVFDEASGIPKPLWMAAMSLLTNDESRFLVIGNPDDPQSHFATVCKPNSGFNVITIPLESTPNFTGEKVHESVRKRMPTQAWLTDFIRQFGMGNAYNSKIKAEFPDSAQDGIVPCMWLQKAMQREREITPEIELGMDVAGSETGDETVIRARAGQAILDRWGMRSADPEEIADWALKIIAEQFAVSIKIDAVGVGFGVYGLINAGVRRMGLFCKVIPVNVGTASTNPKMFRNLRSQLWWDIGREGMREHIQADGLDEKTQGELLAPKYSKNSLGQIVVEPKADTRLRLERSPDDADALLLAFYTPTGAQGATTMHDKRLSRRR